MTCESEVNENLQTVAVLAAPGHSLLQLEVEVDAVTGAVSLSAFCSVCHTYFNTCHLRWQKRMLNMSSVAIPHSV